MCLQYGVDTILKLIWVSVRLVCRLGGLTNSLTILEEPFKASLWTLDESLLEDLDFEEVLDELFDEVFAVALGADIFAVAL